MVIGTTVCTGGLAVIWGTVRYRGHKIWATKSLEGDVDAIGDKVRGHEVCLKGLKQENTHQNRLLEEGVVKPLARLGTQMDEMMTRQSKHGEAIAGLQAAQKGLGKSVDDLRDQVKAVRDR
jgi:hypothetical protein